MRTVPKDHSPQIEAVRRFVQRIINEKRLHELDTCVAPDIDFDHRRPGQAAGVEGLAESLVTLFNAIPDIYIELISTRTTGNTIVADCALHGSVFIWPIEQRPINIKRSVVVFEVREDRIASIQSPRRLRETEDNEEDDDDGGAGQTPAGPRWVPPRPPSGSRTK